MRRRSIWQADSRFSATFPALSNHLETDILVIGGGITGLTAALELQKQNLSVVLVEGRKIGENTTGFSSCHLTTDIDEGYSQLSENFDTKTAAIVAESRMAAIDFMEQTIKEKKISCDFKRIPGYLFSEIPEDVSYLKEEYAYAGKAGLPVELTDYTPLPFHTKKSIRFENQAEFNAVNYLGGIASSLQNTIRIFENSQVTEVKKDGDYFLIKTNQGSIHASRIVMATHLPLFFNVLQTVAAPYISYMLAAQLKNPEYAEALFWDTAEPYHYIRYHRVENADYVIIGGEDHKTGHEKNTAKRFVRLEKYARDRFSLSSIDYKWSAQYYEPADGLPYIGRSPFSENIFVATGFSGDGLVYGTIAGMIISDMIMGKENIWQKVYNSTRFTPAVSTSDFIKENADVVKRFVKDRIKAEEEDITELKPGEGQITRIDGEPVAVMCNENHELKAVSAICPHLKCLVNWNNFEQTWDCPCHGSRFNEEGKVIYGPATKDLKAKILANKETTDKNQNPE